ncbi:hypothetical protein GCM10018954_101790 [Kutzneria kofuensis]
MFQQLCKDARSLPTDDRTTDQKRSDALLDRLRGTKRDWTSAPSSPSPWKP